MKKVYLVYAGFYYKDGRTFEVMLNLFASEKKAVTYLAFKELSFKHRGGITFGDSNIVSVHLHISCETICTYDWSDELMKLQDEELSERSDANRIAADRNNELTNKSNLLEFV